MSWILYPFITEIKIKKKLINSGRLKVYSFQIRARLTLQSIFCTFKTSELVRQVIRH